MLQRRRQTGGHFVTVFVFKGNIVSALKSKQQQEDQICGEFLDLWGEVRKTINMIKNIIIFYFDVGLFDFA